MILCFSTLSQDKIKYAKKMLPMEEALAQSGMSAISFFEKYKKVVSHNFTKDMSNPNYLMLRNFLRGLQDKPLIESDEIIISVTPKNDHNFIVFNMYGRDPNKNVIKKRKIDMAYKVKQIDNNRVRTTVNLLHGKVVEFMIDKLGIANSIAIPKKEILTMRLDRENDQLFYDVELVLVTETQREIVEKLFTDTFFKIKKIASEELVPAINAIED